MKIKNYIWLVLVIGFTGTQAAAQKAPAQRLSASERTAAIDTKLSTTCAEEAPKTARVLAHDTQVFSKDRLASTLNGVWLGRVSGEYDKQLFAKDGFLNVDYYMVVDVNRGEVFVLQEFGSKRPGAKFRAKAGAPMWSYVWCARENYKSPSPRQVHEFVKVSDNINDARELVNGSTGMKVANEGSVVLSNVWRNLVQAKFFDDPSRSLAYAGVLFKPFTMGNVASALGGGSLFQLKLEGEYRGSGQTAAKFIPGEPIRGTEEGQFLGVSMDGGDYLVSSFALGNAMCCAKEDALAHHASSSIAQRRMLFDKVVIGPLAKSGSAPVRKK